MPKVNLILTASKKIKYSNQDELEKKKEVLLEELEELGLDVEIEDEEEVDDELDDSWIGEDED